MIGMLSGSAVRDMDGTTGRIVAWNLPEMRIGWDDGKLLPREESLDQFNPRVQHHIEVLTLDAGWRPLGEFTGYSGAPRTTNTQQTISQLRTLMNEADAMSSRRHGRRLVEAGKDHYPYKNKSTLGPGPRGGTNKKVDEWTCKCSNYTCKCKGKGGRKKTVKINKSYKKAYNKEFKLWRRKKEG